MRRAIRLAAIGLVVVLAQWLVLGRLRLWGAYPDGVLLYVAWVGIRHGRGAGMTSGFALGLLADALDDTWGIQAFAKTLVGFLVGLFPASERESLLILPQQALFGGLAIALLHNGLYATLLILSTGARTPSLLTTVWLGSAAYTALLSLAAGLYNYRQRR